MADKLAGAKTKRGKLPNARVQVKELPLRIGQIGGAVAFYATAPQVSVQQ
jgi:hypothetical protein